MYIPWVALYRFLIFYDIVYFLVDLFFFFLSHLGDQTQALTRPIPGLYSTFGPILGMLKPT